jgi:glutamyl-tRNA synthetase
MPAVGLQPSDLPEILVHDFRFNGYLPEVLLNFLALLGWSPGGDRERMSMDEMVQLFSIEGIGKANAKFAREKLLAFNTEALAAASDDRLLGAMKDFLSVNTNSPLNRATDAQLLQLLHMKKGMRTLREAEQACRFFFVTDDAITYQPDAVEKVLRKNGGEGAAVLREVRQVLDRMTQWVGEGRAANPRRRHGLHRQPADLPEPGVPRPRAHAGADRAVSRDRVIQFQ